ncbi:MAG: DNA cytosine methyltransferase [Caulobacterales bacterium]
MRPDSPRTFYEFFAGAGMARMGLGQDWTCLFANDFDPAKTLSYETHFGPGSVRCADINSLRAKDLPPGASAAPDLAWASFPCQDLSLAGARAGLSAPRSGAFYAFWRLVEELREDNRAPRVVALENVAGLLTSRGGADFASIISTMTKSGYHTGALLVDAADFLPQSRLRLFIIGYLGDAPADLFAAARDERYSNPALQRAVEALPKAARKRFVWWRLPPSPLRNTQLTHVIDWDAPHTWRSASDTRTMLAQMSATQRARVDSLRKTPGRHVGALYRRIRVEDGKKVQRAEARFDGVAGCLRTPGGGSSRQFLVVIEDGAVRTRLFSPRETARLMGMPDDYVLPDGTTKALHLTGDGVAAPVVRHLAQSLIEPLLDSPAAGGASERRSARKAKAA